MEKTAITVRPLGKENLQDYFDFFENTAFCDLPRHVCYCTRWNMTEQEMIDQIRSPVASNQCDLRSASRAAAEKLISKHSLRGYLAYVDGKVVGWCNANDKKSYKFLGADVEINETASNLDKIKSIACFEVAPGYQALGVASELLSYVCEDAKKDGYTLVEGYPAEHSMPDPVSCAILKHIYEKMGFKEITEGRKNGIYQKRI